VSFVKIALPAVLAAALSAQSTTLHVVVSRADARSEANDTSQVVSKYGYGQALDVRGTVGDYVKVVSPTPVRGQLRVEGYVPRADVMPGAPPVTAITTEGIAVSVDVPGTTHWLTPSRTRAVPVAGDVSSVAELSDGRAVSAALSGATILPTDPSATVSWIWLTPRAASSTVVSGARPEIMALFNNAEGMSTDEMVPALVRLVPAGDSGWSLLTVAHGRADAPFRADQDWAVAKALQQSVVPVEARAAGSGVITIRPASALPAGEYAVVLRPAYGKALAGDGIFSPDGDGVVFRAAWRMTVK
jgi:hypothetical protein